MHERAADRVVVVVPQQVVPKLLEFVTRVRPAVRRGQGGKDLRRHQQRLAVAVVPLDPAVRGVAALVCRVELAAVERDEQRLLHAALLEHAQEGEVFLLGHPGLEVEDHRAADLP